MSLRSFRFMFAAYLVLLLAMPLPALAWGNTGHEAVAYIAWQKMSPATRARVTALLKSVPELKNGTTVIPGYRDWVKHLPAGLTEDEKDMYLFMRAATWPDNIRSALWLKDNDSPPAGRTVEDIKRLGFDDGENHKYWHFVDQGFASDNSPVKPTPQPNAETQIQQLQDALKTNESASKQAFDLVWLEHLVGDIHQPLHATTRFYDKKSDNGGNGVKVHLSTEMNKEFKGTLGKDDIEDLHAFWDDLPGEGADADATLQQAAAFGKQALQDVPRASGADQTIADWAQESVVLAKKDAYANPIGAGPTQADGGKYEMTETYRERAMKDSETRIAQAGARLAELLNRSVQ